MPTSNRSPFVSTFLSYSSADRELVLQVARELGTRGVLPIMDDDNMPVAVHLPEHLKRIIERQEFFTVFLTRQSIVSPWVELEVQHALTCHDNSRILVVRVGVKPEDAYHQSSPLAAWGSRDIKDVCASATEGPRIAGELANAIYLGRNLANADDVAVFFDQRGSGMRRGEPVDVPEDLTSASPVVPILVFRNDRAARTPYATLATEPWREFSRAVVEALGTALGQSRTRTARVCGSAQLGLAWLTGWHFDRDSRVRLWCYNVRDAYHGGRMCFNNLKQLARGPHLETDGTPKFSSHPRVQVLQEDTDYPEVALLLGQSRYVRGAASYVREALGGVPLVWFETGGLLDADQVDQTVADIVATVSRLRDANGVGTLHVLNCLPFHVTPLIAAHFTKRVERPVYHEFRRDLEGRHPIPLARDMYAPLPMDERQHEGPTEA